MSQKIQVKHLKTGDFLGQNIDLANNFYTRLVGLMFASSFGNRDGIWFKPSNSIHSFFVRIKFDVLFIDRNNKIIKIYRSFKPWRATRIYWSSTQVLELPEGTLSENVCVGDELEVIHV